MTTATITLSDFLMARITDDEAVARAAIGEATFQKQTGAWRSEVLADQYGPSRLVFAVADGGGKTQVADLTAAWESAERAAHIARHDPARVLAECAAKRAIMAEHRLITDPARLVKVWRDPTPGVACERCANDPLGDGPLEDIGPCDTWRILAAVYADHPDYDPSWAV